MAPAAEDAGSPSTLYRYRLSHPNGLSWTHTDVADPDSRVFSIDSRGWIRLAAHHCSDLRFRFDPEFCKYACYFIL